MSDVDQDEIHPSGEQQAEDQWVAEYVDPYRGVPRPADFRNWTDREQGAWRRGADAALEAHEDVIKRCNEALQRVTGGQCSPWMPSEVPYV